MTSIAIIALVVTAAALTDAAHTRHKLRNAQNRLHALATIRDWLSDDDLDWQADLDDTPAGIPTVEQLRAMWNNDEDTK